jgi:hypothetical protein
MRKNIRLIILIVAVLFVLNGIYLVLNTKKPSDEPKAFDPTNASYIIDKQAVQFIDGQSSSENNINGFTAMIFGKVIYGDLNNNQVDDAAVLIQMQGGGSGIFYYVAAAINSNSQAQGSEAILLGDRIDPQNIAIQDQYIVANYMIRKPGDSMAISPSLGVSSYFIIDDSGLHLTGSPLQMISYFASIADKNIYCNGVNMESLAYQKTIVESRSASSDLIKPSTAEFIKNVILAATNDNCHETLANTDISFNNGVVNISPIEGWAGASIAMCICKPEVEVNLLSLPGVNQIVWSSN